MFIVYVTNRGNEIMETKLMKVVLTDFFIVKTENTQFFKKN